MVDTRKILLDCLFRDGLFAALVGEEREVAWQTLLEVGDSEEFQDDPESKEAFMRGYEQGLLEQKAET